MEMNRSRAFFSRRGAGGRFAGFTLIELMFTVVILAVLLSLGAPMLRNLVLDQRIKTVASDIHGSLIYARSEALKRNADISVVAAGAGWVAGWEVRLGATVLKRQDALSDMTITATDQNGNTVTTLTYRGDGRLGSTATFLIRTSETAVTARCVRLDVSGRPNVQIDTNKNPDDGCN